MVILRGKYNNNQINNCKKKQLFSIKNINEPYYKSQIGNVIFAKFTTKY